MDEVYSHPAHQASPIVPVQGTLSWVAGTSDVALTPEQDGVDQRLRPVEVIEQKGGCCNEGEEDGEVIGSEVV